MCRKVLLCMFALMGVLTSYGQGDSDFAGKSKIVHPSLYVEGGWNLSSCHSGDKSLSPEFSSVSGFAIGAGANMRFLKSKYLQREAENGLLAFQAGILYAQSGFKTRDEKVTGNYVCIPMSFQCYNPWNWGNNELFIALETEICLNVGLSPSSAVIQGLSIDFSEHKANDFKIGPGVGYMRKFGKIGPVGFSLKYLFGTSEFAENLPWKGNQLRLSVFWRFGL